MFVLRPRDLKQGYTSIFGHTSTHIIFAVSAILLRATFSSCEDLHLLPLKYRCQFNAPYRCVPVQRQNASPTVRGTQDKVTPNLRSPFPALLRYFLTCFFVLIHPTPFRLFTPFLRRYVCLLRVWSRVLVAVLRSVSPGAISPCALARPPLGLLLCGFVCCVLSLFLPAASFSCCGFFLTFLLLFHFFSPAFRSRFFAGFFFLRS